MNDQEGIMIFTHIWTYLQNFNACEAGLVALKGGREGEREGKRFKLEWGILRLHCQELMKQVYFHRCDDGKCLWHVRMLCVQTILSFILHKISEFFPSSTTTQKALE